VPETLSCTSDASLDFLWVSSGVGLARAILFLSFTTQKVDRTSSVASMLFLEFGVFVRMLRR